VVPNDTVRRKENFMIRKMLCAAVLAVTLLGSQASAARAEGLYFKNYSSETVYVAVAYFDTGINGWRVIGWYPVEPARTAQILRGALDQRYYYYRANTASHRWVWEGNYSFIAHPTQPFSILRMGGVYHAVPRGADMMHFDKIDTGPFTHFTVNLR
jgi:uncharacterized membrane protein